MDRIEFINVEIEPLEEFILYVRKFFSSTDVPLLNEFSDFDFEYAQFHLYFLSQFLQRDEGEMKFQVKAMTEPMRREIATQLDNCRLLCVIARERGWSRLVIPKDVSLFFSIVPKQHVLAVNEERYSKGIESSEPGFLVIETVPPKDKAH